ncbi:MAG: biopolymer transporter TolR [Bacteroidota bacterium]
MKSEAQTSIGVFDNNGDVGNPALQGSAKYTEENQRYELTGSGVNIWTKKDQFHYIWKRIKGNFILQARGNFIGKGAEAHRKFGWMIRSSLDTNAAMACATVHGDGLTSLQYRKIKDANVEEVKSLVSGPDIIQLERKGSEYIMSVAHWGEPFVSERMTGLDIGDEVYAGLFICSHNKDVTEKVSFDNVRIIIPAKDNFVPYREYIGSNIETMDVTNGARKILYTSPVSLQAPNWTTDNKALIYNSDGLIYRFDLDKKKPEVVNTDFVKKNNNDHVISFDGKMLGLSSTGTDSKDGSIVYTMPLTGGKPKQITPTGPSYLHGWSPDGKFLIFTGQRNKDFDIYKVPSEGGAEINLTNSPGLDDGSEYSPDGKYIYFNSVRSGTMQLWRMKQDGTNPEQLTNDEFNNWFPHVSPDGKWIVFISFMKDVSPDDHPFYKHVYLRLLPVAGGKPKVIAYLYGGQGTINTPSWSPDSKHIAFISNSDSFNK